MRPAVLAAFLGLSLAFWGGPSPAQAPGTAFDQGIVRSPVLVLDFDRLFAQSAFGRRVTSKIEAQGEDLAAENRRIETDLTDEERRLTEQRATLSAAEFRQLANAFDEKVQRLRSAQDAKTRALGQVSDGARRQFVAAAQPVLKQLMRDAGAAVILERRAVLVAADVVDITATAIQRIDEAIGAGEALPTGDDAPPVTP